MFTKIGILTVLSVVTQNIQCQRTQSSNERVGNLDWTPPDFDPTQFAEDRFSQGENCECVFFYLCDRNTGRIIDTGSGLVRWRTGGTDTPKKCKEIGQVCCKSPLWAEKIEGTEPEDNQNPDLETSSQNNGDWDLPTLPDPASPGDTSSNQGSPTPINENYPDNPDEDVNDPEPDQPTDGNHAIPSPALRCGERKPQTVDYRQTALRVSGGEEETETRFGEYPWMVMVHTIDRSTATELRLFLCGGSLIHPQVVMTAAHCIAGKNIQDLETRAGEWDTTTESEPSPHQNRLVDSISIHPQYNETHPRHDIALILLKEQFVLADNVNTICLPQDDTSYVGSHCVGTGWGMDNSGKRAENQGLLRKADLPVVSKDECQRMLRKTRLGRYFRLHSSFICAGGEDLDLCVGDGGGPLTCLNEREGNEVQIGITSWGIGCGTKGIPGVYTDVAAHRDWITSTIDYLLKGYNK